MGNPRGPTRGINNNNRTEKIFCILFSDFSDSLLMLIASTYQIVPQLLDLFSRPAVRALEFRDLETSRATQEARE
jgi:hypothetical protein